MPTRISARRKNDEGKNNQILFECKESPRDVLRILSRQHHIFSYKNIPLPTDANFPSNCEGLIIAEINEDIYLSSVISEKGLSIQDLDVTKIKGYDASLVGKNPHFFANAIISLIESRLGPQTKYGWIKVLHPMREKNYLLVRDSDIVRGLKNDTEKKPWGYPGEENAFFFVPAEWVGEQEVILQIILEIAQTSITGVETIADLVIFFNANKK
jgi:hypothetical protein